MMIGTQIPRQPIIRRLSGRQIGSWRRWSLLYRRWLHLRQLLRRRGGDSQIMAHGELSLGLLLGQIDQFHEFADQLLDGRVVFLRFLNLVVMLAVVEAHD